VLVTIEHHAKSLSPYEKGDICLPRHALSQDGSSKFGSIVGIRCTATMKTSQSWSVTYTFFPAILLTKTL
jgi:hypothetical protein